MTEAPPVSVIVLNYNGRRWLERCLASLAAQQGILPEVIVVDNASTDGSCELVERSFPGVHVLRLPENVGFAAGNNAGARRARGRFLAFLNNDAEADPRWAVTLKAALDADADASLVTSCIVWAHDPALVDSAGDGYTRAGGAFKRGHGRPAADYTEPAEVFGACGAAFMVRRECFEALDGFDEDFFLVYEDVDLSYRAQLAGYRCLYVPEGRVLHAGSGTMGRLSATAVFYGQRNLEWVYLKNTPWPILLLTWPAHAAYSLAGGAYLASRGHLGTWFAAKRAALAGLPGVLAKRRAVQRARRVSSCCLWNAMERGWVARKWREKRFDLETTRSR